MSSRASASSGGEIVTVSCGAMANWTTMQYMMLQNSNCDINSNYSRHTHFRRTEASAKAEAGSIVGAGAGASAGGASPTSPSTWMPRLVCMDASVGLDGIVATFANDSSEADQTRSDELAAEVQRKHRVKQQGANKSSSSSSSSGAIPRPKHWRELHQHVFPLHGKSAYSVPGLYEGTSDFHLHEHGTELMQREAVHEEVIDRVRYFLEECDQPDGLHVVVEGNSGWSGVGSSLLDLLRDEYERMPIFCIGTLTPPPPASAYGRSFSSATSVAQSVINSSLLLNAVTAHASNIAYLPLTTHYFPSHSLSQTILPEQRLSLQRGELYESSMLLAWLMHLNTASYRIQPKLTSLASVVSQLTQGQAGVLATRLLAYPPSNEDELDLADEHNVHAAVHAHSKAVEAGSASSSIHKATPVLHTMPETFPMSVLGHSHSFAPASSKKDDDDDFSASSQSSKPSACGLMNGLNELVHVFGRSSTASHAELINQFTQQPTAQFRHVYGSSRMNLPTTFHSEYYQLLNEGHVASLYRCRALGEELNELGCWLHELNRGVVHSSYYTSSSEGAASPSSAAAAPKVLANFVNGGGATQQRKAAAEFDEDGDRILGKVPSSAAQQLPTFTQDQLEAISEAGIALQNLSEYY